MSSPEVRAVLRLRARADPLRADARRPSRHPASVTPSASPSEVAEQPPEQQEDQHRAEASTTKLLGSVTRGESAKQLAHHHSLGRGPEMSAEDVPKPVARVRPAPR